MKIRGFEIKPFADLSGANLSRANLSRADLSKANLSEADLSGANLSRANLIEADLSFANLSRADLSKADLSGADLSGANLSRAKIYDSKKWLSTFKTDEIGIYVFKDVASTFYRRPKSWMIAPESFIEENVNPNPTDECGCGVNFATLEWLSYNSHNQIWRCLIYWEDAHSIVVPYNTDGKARCGRLQLIEKLEA